MPGYDGTGPMGKGPMSGGGFGYCAQDTAAAGMPRGAGRGGRPWGGGRGRCFGGGRGPGWRGFDGTPGSTPNTPLDAQLDAISRRLAALEKKFEKD